MRQVLAHVQRTATSRHLTVECRGVLPAHTEYFLGMRWTPYCTVDFGEYRVREGGVSYEDYVQNCVTWRAEGTFVEGDCLDSVLRFFDDNVEKFSYVM